MQGIDISSPIILIPLVMVIVIILFFIIYSSRYRKFSIDEYVIWLRNGEVWKSGLGGSGWLMPLIDQIIIVSAAMQLTKIDVELYDYQQAQKTLIVGIELNWRVNKPEIFYRRFFSTKDNTIKSEELFQLYRSFLRDTLASKTIDDLYGKSRSIMHELKDSLNGKLNNSGVLLESVEIETVTNL